MLYSGYFATTEEAETYLRHNGFIAASRGCWHRLDGRACFVTEIPNGVLVVF